MIAYLDGSAIVPILIAEPTTRICQRVWRDADRRVSCRLAYVEASAALAAAERYGRITESEHRVARANLDRIWPDVDVIEIGDEVARSAAEFARSLALRGYDAVHCASAHAIADSDVVAVGGDAALLEAWESLGLAVLDTNG